MVSGAHCIHDATPLCGIFTIPLLPQRSALNLVMPWNSNLLLSFGGFPPLNSDDDYQGGWNKILNTLFPSNTPCMVAPQRFMPNDNPAANFVSMFEVRFRNRPVLTVLLSGPLGLDSISTREQADDQIRTYFGDRLGKYTYVIAFCDPWTLIGKNQSFAPFATCMV